MNFISYKETSEYPSITRDISFSIENISNLKKIENRDGFKEAIKDKGSGEVKRFFNLGPNNKWEKILDSEIKDEITQKISYSISKGNRAPSIKIILVGI